MPRGLCLVPNGCRLACCDSISQHNLKLIIPSAAYMRRWTGPALVQVMTCRLFVAKWRLVWSVNFALYAEPAKLWRHNNLILARHLTITLVSTTFYCSKADVTMVSGGLATLHTHVPYTPAKTGNENVYTENIKITPMETVNTGVLYKNKEVKIKPKRHMMYQNIYDCICKK